MTQYELPDGFEGMETVLRDRYVTLIKPNGYQSVHWIPSNQNISLEYVGWSPIVPLKAKAAWSMEISENGGWFDFRHNGQPSHGIATGRIDRKTANKLLAVLNEVMP